MLLSDARLMLNKIEAKRKDSVRVIKTSFGRNTLVEAAKKFRDAFTYDPGHSDLDNEQPITVTVTLGDWRKLDMALIEEQAND